jgi:hypothetical protein
MMRTQLVLLLFMAVWLAGCDQTPASKSPTQTPTVAPGKTSTAPEAAKLPPVAQGLTRIDDTALVMALQSQLEQASGMMDKLIVVRLRLDGVDKESINIQPLIVAAKEWNGLPSKTIFTIDSQKDNWILFSREGDSGLGYQAILPLNSLKPGDRFSFPVVGEKGQLEKKLVEISMVKRQ